MELAHFKFFNAISYIQQYLTPSLPLQTLDIDKPGAGALFNYTNLLCLKLVESQE